MILLVAKGKRNQLFAQQRIGRVKELRKLVLFGGLCKEGTSAALEKRVGRVQVLLQKWSSDIRRSVIWAPYWRKEMLWKTSCRHTFISISFDKTNDKGGRNVVLAIVVFVVSN